MESCSGRRFRHCRIVYLRSIALFESCGKTYDIECVRALNNLGAMYLGMDRLDEAEKVYRRAFAIALEGLCTGRSIDCRYHRKPLGVTEFGGDFTESDPLLNQFLSVYKKNTTPFDILGELA